MLKINNLKKKYKKITAINDISLTALPGEIIALVGPNGSGKTTLMKAVSGLITINEGNIEIDGITFSSDREKYLSLLSCIIETPALYLSLNGYDNLMFIKRLNKITDDDFNAILKVIDLKDRIYNKTNTYSLGMKQRLALGMALIKKPKVFLLDEPVNGMDPVSAENFYNIIKYTADKYTSTFLISSHILSELGSISDRILFLDKGNIIKEVNTHDDSSNLKDIYMSLYRGKSDEYNY